MPEAEMICRFADECSGCTSWDIPLEVQQQKKKRDFFHRIQDLWPKPLPDIQIQSLGLGFLRDRLDFTLEDKNFGLLRKARTGILDLSECLQLSPELQEFLTQFRKMLPPINKGSIRLRIGVDGKKGIWLDLANKDIQFLFEEKAALKDLLNIAFVEVGQRRKKLIWQDTPEPRFRLVDPELQTWTQTFSNGRAIPLWGYVSSFTQTGLRANRKIAEIIEQLIATIPRKTARSTVYEFGAGLGTLTLPLLKALPEAQIKIFESDQLSLQGLRKTLQIENLESAVEIFGGDFQKEMQSSLPQADIVVLNPPRSGVGNFMQQISKSTQALIYMSCYAESLASDCDDLKDQGFHLAQIHMIDQFPQSYHAEWITLWLRNT